MEIFYQKFAFLRGARFTFKVSLKWRQRLPRKFFASVNQNWISQNKTKQDPLGRQGLEALRKPP